MSTERRFLVMTSGPHAYALPLEQVSAVLDPCPLAPVPRAPIWCLGAVQHSGVVVAVIDLALYVGEESVQHPEKIVVLDLHAGGLGLLVERVADIMVANEQLLEQDTHGFWLETASGRAELLNATELIQEVAAAMAK